MSEEWNVVKVVKKYDDNEVKCSGKQCFSEIFQDNINNMRAVKRDMVLHLNRSVYNALKELYKDREPLFDIKTTGTVKDNVLYKNEVIVHE